MSFKMASLKITEYQKGTCLHGCFLLSLSSRQATQWNFANVSLSYQHPPSPLGTKLVSVDVLMRGELGCRV